MISPMTNPRGKKRSVTRSIHFFRMDAGADASGKPVKIDLAAAVEEVSKLPFGPTSRRYWTQPSGDAIGLWVPSVTAYDRFSLATIRRSSLPQSELNGTLSDLNLGAGAGLHEPVHMKVLPNNILGVEFNFYGPRPSRLPMYLEHAIASKNGFELEALLRQDAAAQLKNHSEIRVLDLYIRPSYVASVEEANKGLGKAFRAIEAASKAEVIGLTLRPEPYKRTALGAKMLKGVKRLAKRKDLNENVSTFKVKGFNQVEDRSELLDLLQDQLVAKKQILTLGDRSRAIDPGSAFDAIDEAYDELESQIEAAAGIGVKHDSEKSSENS